MKKYLALSLVLLIAAIGLGVYTTLQIKHLTIGEDVAGQSILRLHELDNKLNELVLRSRYGLSTNFDELTRVSTDLSRTLSVLDTAMQMQPQLAKYDMDNDIKKYESETVARLDAVENFKRHHAVLRNSAKYAPEVGGKLLSMMQKTADGAEGSALIEEANEAAYSFLLFGDDRSYQTLSSSLQEIRELFFGSGESSLSGQSFGGNYSTLRYEYLSHIRTLLEEKPQTEIYMQRSLADSQTYLENITNAYAKFKRDRQLALEKAEKLWWASYSVAFLSIAVLFIAIGVQARKRLQNQKSIITSIGNLGQNSALISRNMLIIYDFLQVVKTLEKRVDAKDDNLPPLKQYLKSTIRHFRKINPDENLKHTIELMDKNRKQLTEMSGDILKSY